MSAVGAVGAIPVPVRGTVCGEPEASSVMVMAPVRTPVAVGVKVTVMVHVPKDATVAPHVVVREKSPDATIEAMCKVMLPVLVSVTVCVALGTPTVVEPKVRLEGDNEMLRDVPTPVNVDVCGEPEALSVLTSVAVRVPASVGLKVTGTEHDVPPAKGDVH